MLHIQRGQGSVGQSTFIFLLINNWNLFKTHNKYPLSIQQSKTRQVYEEPDEEKEKGNTTQGPRLLAANTQCT